VRISTKGRYGLRIMTALAAVYGKGPVLADSIGKSQGISTKYVHNIVSNLKTAGLVRILRGPNGGYELARPPEQTTALEVITALEGPVYTVDCVNNEARCSRSKGCSARDLWSEVADAVTGVLVSHSIAELADREKAKGMESSAFEI
jgi:Rrf2 family transcriptional regulator, cysteine metabolism repressor